MFSPQLCAVQLSTINSYLEVIYVLPQLCAVQLSTMNGYLRLIDVLSQLAAVKLSTINSYLELIDVLPQLCAVQLSTISELTVASQPLLLVVYTLAMPEQRCLLKAHKKHYFTKSR